MGGKSNNSAPAQTYYPEQKQDEEQLMQTVAAMSEMMAQQNNIFAQQMSQNSQAQMPAIPDIGKSPKVDWSEKQEQLKNKMKADFALDQKRRKARMDTVLTSPLLDDEEATTTRSLLKG